METWIAALLIAAATATPPDFSGDGKLQVLVPEGQRYETSVAISGNTVVIAVIEIGDIHPIDLFVSPNRGLTWSGPIEMPLAVDGTRYQHGTDPTIVVLDDGSFGLAYLLIENTPSIARPVLGDERLVFVRSTDGVTWSAPVTLFEAQSGLTPIADRPWLSVDRLRGTLFATWGRTQGAGEDAVLQTSNDRGATWSAPAAVTPKSEELAQIAALPNGTLVEVNLSGTAYVTRTSSNGGAFWSAPQTIGNAGNATISAGTKTSSPPMAVLTSHGDDL